MFTGIIETLGKVSFIKQDEGNVHLGIESKIFDELKIDQSVSHNGVCLTVVQLENGIHTVTAIQETIQKTNLRNLKIGDEINLERCLQAGGRLDGHMVQGHVDGTAKVLNVKETQGSWEYRFQYHSNEGHFVVPKGSICINGVSLTVVDALPNEFSVAIIPYTYEHTTFKYLKTGDTVNLEFDVLGKYVTAYLKQMGLEGISKLMGAKS